MSTTHDFVGKETKDIGGDPHVLVSAQDSKLPRAPSTLALPFLRPVLHQDHIPTSFLEFGQNPLFAYPFSDFMKSFSDFKINTCSWFFFFKEKIQTIQKCIKCESPQ